MEVELKRRRRSEGLENLRSCDEFDGSQIATSPGEQHWKVRTDAMRRWRRLFRYKQHDPRLCPALLCG
jgi:hypothetical protein